MSEVPVPVQQVKPAPGHGVDAIAETCRATPGHFDEVFGQVSVSSGEKQSAPVLEATSQGMTRDWADFFNNIEDNKASDMDQRAASLARQIRDNGITYNVYADADGPQRPWSLDLFPCWWTRPLGNALKPVCCSESDCWSTSWPTPTARRRC